MMEPERRRRRPAVSCILCRRRKIRCNRETPCSNCTKSKNATCVYRDGPRPPRRDGPQGSFGETSLGQAQASESAAMAPLTPSSSAPSTHQARATSHPAAPPHTAKTAASTSSAAVSAANSPAARSHGGLSRNRTTGDQAGSSARTSADTPASTPAKHSSVETTTLHFMALTSDIHFHAEHRLASQPQAVTRSVSHKTRMFGQSHWVNAVAMLSEMISIFENHLNDPACKTVITEQRCKALAKVIKARRRPPWPCPPTPDLPGRLVADALVESYLTTSETILRVLHIPSFRRDYEAVWDVSSNPDPVFLVQLKLVLAIGSVAYDSAFSLRPHAVRWVYEAQTWVSAPEFKHRLGIAALQISILLSIARYATDVGEDMVWATLGTTLRMAMYMGVHRDPAGLGLKTVTPLVAEMRRRLWNTILELVLQSSLISGGPPLISLDEFDTEPPGNFDDDQLTGQEGEDPMPKPHGHFTQTTIAIALRNLLPQRLAIAKYLNDLSSRRSYAETLRLDAELREAYKTLTRTLQACKTPSRGPSDFELRTVDLILRWQFLALHLPFFKPALQETEFAFSRRTVVETALRFWRAAFPVPLTTGPGSADDDLLSRIAINGSGFFRTTAVQGFVAINIELKALAKEEEGLSLGPVELRPDLLLALDDFKMWAWKSIETGQTNAKCYLVACMVHAQVEAARRGLNEEESVAFVLKAAEESEEEALALLEGIEARGRQPEGDAVMGVGVDDLTQGLDSTPGWSVEDWDFMTSDVMFNSAGPDPLSWVFQ